MLSSISMTNYKVIIYNTKRSTLPQIRLATLDGDIVDSEIAVKFEMGDALKLHGAQT